MGRAATALLLAFLVATSAHAGLISINPLLPGASAGTEAAETLFSPMHDASTERVSERAGLDPRDLRLPLAAVENGRWLFGGMVEASSTASIDPAFGAHPRLVRMAVEQDRLVVYEENLLVPEIPGVTEAIVNRYPCRVEGDAVHVDLTRPEIEEGKLKLGNFSYEAHSGGMVFDLCATEDYVGWVRRYVFEPKEGTGEPVTLFMRFFFKLYRPTGYRPKIYGAAERRRFGFFHGVVTAKTPAGDPVQTAVVRRWNLADEKTITYWLHPTIPERYRPAVERGILAWNDVFERAVGRRPIEVKLATADMLPSDVRHNVIYWVGHLLPGSSAYAYGPSSADPLTGEIFDGDVVIMGAAWLRKLAKDYGKAKKARAETDGTPAAPASGEEPVAPETARPRPAVDLRLGGELTLRLDGGEGDPLLPEGLKARIDGSIERYPDLDAYVSAYLEGILCHEVGHTLGLRHNFVGSADAEHAAGAASTSIMDYYDFDRMTAPGAYDLAAIAFGYDGDASLWQESAFAYATDEHLALVPEANQFDEGDPFVFYKSAYETLSQALDDAAAQGKLPAESSFVGRIYWCFEHLRKYVNRHETHGMEAFAMLYALLRELPAKGANPAQLRLNYVRRFVAADVLFAERGKVLEGNWNEQARFAPLTEGEQGHLVKLFAASLASPRDGLSFRRAAIRFLKRMQSAPALAALRKARKTLRWQGVSDAINVFHNDQAEADARLELRSRIDQVLAAYWD